MIFYFSGTGNTLWAARHLAQKTGEELLSIADMTSEGRYEYELKDGERLGFCFPTHGWQPPRIVRNFVSQLQVKNADGHYCYALTTCGDSIGKTMELLNEELAKAGLHTHSVFSLIMPESYVCLPFMYTDSPQREHEKIMLAQKQLNNITKMVILRTVGIEKTVKGAAPWLMTHVIGNYFNTQLVTDKKFTVDDDVCIHCGKCETVCPTGDVLLDGESRLPQWKHNGSCTCCLACYHHCPRHAINYSNITRKRGQYYFSESKLEK